MAGVDGHPGFCSVCQKGQEIIRNGDFAGNPQQSVRKPATVHILIAISEHSNFTCIAAMLPEKGRSDSDIESEKSLGARLLPNYIWMQEKSRNRKESEQKKSEMRRRASLIVEILHLQKMID